MAAAFFTEFFPPQLRYSGSAISYQVSAAVGAIALRGAARKSNELAQRQQVPSEAPAPAST
ncbi:hypothetical protein ACH4TX_00115 [Streptomyces sp. NPDC021098]|uniref:hypothetical protein n=1 Tax=unclassified Streptomyces TaxID=2593676 RepID=UPI003788C55D